MKNNILQFNNQNNKIIICFTKQMITCYKILKIWTYLNTIIQILNINLTMIKI